MTVLVQDSYLTDSGFSGLQLGIRRYDARRSPHFLVLGKNKRFAVARQPIPYGQRHVFVSLKTQCAFPNDCNSPTQIPKIGDVPGVPPDILIELCRPELAVG